MTEVSLPEFLISRLISAGFGQILHRRQLGQGVCPLFSDSLSAYVIDEASDGDPDLAQARLRALEGFPLLELAPAVDAIAEEIMDRSILPAKAQLDALHIALVAYHRIVNSKGTSLPKQWGNTRIKRDFPAWVLPGPNICL